MAYNNDRRDNRRNREEGSELTEKVVSLNRVSKTVKGGRVMKFSALCVVGDGKGRVGYGLGKASEVSEAIRKGLEDAKKHIVNITMQGTTIPHEVMGEFGAGRVLHEARLPKAPAFSPAALSVRSWSAPASRNIRAKCLRSNNPQNVVAATMAGLMSLQERRAGRRCARQDRRRDNRLRRYATMANLKIKLVKSLNGRHDKHIATAHSLGLHKLGNETVQPDNPQTRGKIAQIGYLLQVTEE